MRNGRYEEYGRVVYYKDDTPHREDGPAIEWADSGKQWIVNGVTHRIGGPAFERADGHKEWWVNGKRHRLEGPAIVWANGSETWFVDGEKVDLIDVFDYEPSVPLTEEEQMVLRLRV